jgi:hypothetical protein
MPAGSEVVGRILQVGVEAVKGTPVAATRQWYGHGMIQDVSPDPSMREEERASYDMHFGAEKAIEDFDWSYEGGLDVADVIEQLRAAMDDAKNAGTLGAAGEWSWPFTPGAVLSSLSLELDAGGDVYKSAYAMCDTIEFSGGVTGGDVMVKMGGPCKDRVGASVLTGVGSHSTVVQQGWETKFFLDALGAAPMTTAIDGQLISWNWKISNGLERFRGSANSRLFTKIIRKRRVVESEWVVEMAAQANTEITNKRAVTRRIAGVRIGDNVLINGVTKYRLDLIASGAFVSEPIAESGGVSTVQFKHKSVYDTANAFAYKAIVQNARAA